MPRSPKDTCVYTKVGKALFWNSLGGNEADFVFSVLLQVFVEYANAGDSKAAQKLLTGRMFDGKFVVATFYPLSAYKRGYLYQTLL